MAPEPVVPSPNDHWYAVMAPSGSLDAEASTEQVNPAQVAVKDGVGGVLAGAAAMVKASVKVPEVGTNDALSSDAVIVRSRKPHVGLTLAPDDARK